jgi:hypothetical protein
VLLAVVAAACSFSGGCAEGQLSGHIGLFQGTQPGFFRQAKAEPILGGVVAGAAAARMQAFSAHDLGYGLETPLGVRRGFENRGKREQAVSVSVRRKF